MRTNFVVFHTGPDTLDRYKPLMEIGRRALQKTNPGAEYIVLTDEATAEGLRDFDVVACAPSDMPLMLQFCMAQRAYLDIVKDWDGLSVLAGTDCVAARDLQSATMPDHGVAITYRFGGRCPINNVAYVRDHQQMAWFLDRAIVLMDPSLVYFYGDQEAWADALGPVDNWLPLVPGTPHNVVCIRRVMVEGKEFWLYPCKTHNNAPKRSGAWGMAASRAFLVHFKGTRKEKMVESVRWYIFHESDYEGRQPKWIK